MTRTPACFSLKTFVTVYVQASIEDGMMSHMTQIIVYVATSALALLIANEIIPGLTIDTWQTAVFAAVVLGVLNSFVKPILILLTLPITLITLGLFILVINVLLFMTAAWLLPGFAVAGFVPAALGTILVSVVHLFVGKTQKAD